MARDLYDIVYTLQDIGIYDVLLPILLVFAIMYAILQKIKIFGKDKGAKSVNVVVALVVSLITLLPEYGVVDRINVYLPRFAFIMILMVTLLILMGLIGFKVDDMAGKGVVFTLLFILTLVGLFTVNSESLQNSTLHYLLQDYGWWLVGIGVIIAVFAGIIGFGDNIDEKLQVNKPD